MDAVAGHERDVYLPPSMKGPVVASSLFHLFIFIIGMVGLPFVAKERLIVTPPVNVEIVEIDEVTRTDKKPAPEKPPQALEKPTPPKVTSEVPPDLTAPKPPEIEKMLEKPVKKPEVIPEKPKAKPKPPEKTEKKNNDFASLLKNLAPDVPDNPSNDTSQEEVTEDSQLARLSDKLTMSELDAFKQQIGSCWHVPTGAKYAEDLSVEIRVLINPDMSVKSASIIDQGRYNRDSHFRAAAESARRALINPKCSPLKLPPDKYDQWKSIIINFDPSEML